MHQKARHAHFEGKETLEHLIEARRKKEVATTEVHGLEMPGHISAGIDAGKETALLLALLWTLFQAHLLLVLFALGYLIWKTGRSAILGAARLERMHRVINEERFEIEHHRPQEKEELRELYRARGFSGRLLDEAVEVLMADDNRLLEVMLREELGFRMESVEHPLKQASGAALGVIGSSLLLGLSVYLLPPLGVFVVTALIIAICAAVAAHLERNRKIPMIIWNLAVAFFALGAAKLCVP